MPTFAEFLRERGHGYPPPRTWYPALYESWFRAECEAGRPPDGYDGEGVRGRPVKWTRDTMIAVARRLYQETGKPLHSRLVKQRGSGIPHQKVITEVFGTWGNYMDAAGLPRSGRKPNNDALFKEKR